MTSVTIENVIENSNKLTIITAKKTVNSLYDYLHIKGLYLFAKIRPEDNILSKEDNIAFIVDFLDKTDLKTCPFWIKLERDVKMVAARYITLRDESEMTLISSTRRREAGIFVLLSGRGQLNTIRTESHESSSTTLKHGSVVGPIDLFNKEDDDTVESISYKCKVSSGSVLQLKYLDIIRAKYGDQSITSDPNEGLTHEEITLRDVSLFGESRLSSVMFQFLKKNHLLPTSEKDTSFKYIKNGSIGRSISGKNMENELVIILDGSIRINVGHNAPVENSSAAIPNNGYVGDIKCTHTGEKTATFKIHHIPLSIIENGALLHLDEKILSSGSNVENPSGFGNPAPDLEVDDTSLSLGGVGGGGVGTDPPGTSSSTSPVNFLQHLNLKFDKPTTYMSIPLKKLKNALQNETHRVNIDIWQEVNEVGRGLATRLEKLKPLLGGELVYHGAKTPNHDKVEVSAGDEICNGDISSAESSLAGAYGIFSKLECKLDTSDKS